jgi:hypothetical protein
MLGEGKKGDFHFDGDRLTSTTTTAQQSSFEHWDDKVAHVVEGVANKNNSRR